MALMLYFFVFYITAYVVGTHLNCLNLVEAIQMSTHNICFYKEINFVEAIQMSTNNICFYKEVNKST